MINIKSVFKSIGHALDGLLYVVRTQNNARFHLLVTILVILVSLWFRLSNIEWCFIVIAITLVWVSECFNTALEKLFDLVDPNPHPLIKAGKDSSAAAVLISAILSVVIGILILGPHLITKLSILFIN
jgi:diacylglycerol kinase